MKRSITLRGHRTSISVEDAFWRGLREIATLEKTSPTDLISGIDDKRQPEDNLSSAIRVYVYTYFKEKSETGNKRLYLETPLQKSK